MKLGDVLILMNDSVWWLERGFGGSRETAGWLVGGE